MKLHDEIYPEQTELADIKKIVKVTEDNLKTISDKMREETEKELKDKGSVINVFVSVSVDSSVGVTALYRIILNFGNNGLLEILVTFLEILTISWAYVYYILYKGYVQTAGQHKSLGIQFEKQKVVVCFVIWRQTSDRLR